MAIRSMAPITAIRRTAAITGTATAIITMATTTATAARTSAAGDPAVGSPMTEAMTVVIGAADPPTTLHSNQAPFQERFDPDPSHPAGPGGECVGIACQAKWEFG